MENKLNLIIKEIQFIKEDLIKINKKLEKLEKLENDCSKMSEHIDFVDSIYQQVKYPLNYFTNNYFYKNNCIKEEKDQI